MSRRLPKAPLLEVIFEIRWHINNDDERNRYQYLHGDLYNTLKSEYPFRELVVPSHFPVEVYLNQVAHRFRQAKGGYPLIQIGPGIFTINTIEKDYIWEDFCGQIQNSVKNLITLDSFNAQLPVSLALRYIDFFQFDFNQNDIKDYLNDFLHIKVEQEFFKNNAPPYNINLGFTYGTTVGTLNLSVNKGLVDEVEGLIIQIEVIQQGMNAVITEIDKWLDSAHILTSDTFNNLTKGKLQDYFNS